MRIRETIYKNMNELPGYNLLGYTELAIPIYETRLHSLVRTKSTIPVVEEFILNFYNVGLELHEMEKVLGLDKELIYQAWAGLQQRDYISFIDKHITDRGMEYLENNSVEELEKIEIPIMIDCITGRITTVNKQLMNSGNIKKMGIRSLKAVIDIPSVDSIDFKSVRSVFNRYKRENSNMYSGELIEILHTEGKSTKFKRIEILVFSNNEGDIRILAYDGYNRIDEYEEELKKLDQKGIKLFKYSVGQYFNGNNVKKINNLIEEDKKNHKSISLAMYNEKLNEYINSNDEIIIIIPLVSICDFNTGFINKIAKSLSKGKKIRVIISGTTYINEHQKKVYATLSSFREKYHNLSVEQMPTYMSKMVINEKNKCALVSVYEEKRLELKSSNLGIIEKAFEIEKELFDELKNIVFSSYDIEELLNFQLVNVNKVWLKEKLNYIIKLVRDADMCMFRSDSKGWIGDGEVPNVSQLESSPLCRNSDRFGIFIENLNKSFVESLETNVNDKQYFWNTFKRKYPELQHVLDKIRSYRNKSKHLKLTNDNERKYQSYLVEDLNGYMPEFIENGFLILQTKILNELEKSVKDVIINLKYK